MPREKNSMGYNCIRIEREREGFEVRCTDPAIQKQNESRKSSGPSEPSEPWKDPEVEFTFTTKEQVLKFLEGAMDIALPADTYSSTFDKLAKEAMK
jgi:hypothetical protein